VPWHVVSNHSSCPKDKPFAVVKNDTGEKVSCHETQSSAEAHVRALYTNTRDEKLTRRVY
jgi:hypothetical protein